MDACSLSPVSELLLRMVSKAWWEAKIPSGFVIFSALSAFVRVVCYENAQCMPRGGHLSMSILNKGNEDISDQVPLQRQISLLHEGSLDCSV